MGLYLNYELRLAAAVPESDVATLVACLREHALKLPFAAVTEVARLTNIELAERPPLLAPLSMSLEHVSHFNAVAIVEQLYAHSKGIRDEDVYERRGNDIIYHPIEIPRDMPVVAYAFSIGVGAGSEPASLGVLQITPEGARASPWWWQCFCKTQYASVHGDENLLRCHRALVTALDIAQSLGFRVTVLDETGYWESRDDAELLRAVTRMNQLIAGFAGCLTDAAREIGADSRGISAEIFKHPDFERLEMAEPNVALRGSARIRPDSG